MGRVTHAAAAQGGLPAWAARAAHNELGQETERLLPGGVVCEWKHDAAGLPLLHRVASGQKASRLQEYKWGAGGRLLATVDGPSRSRVSYGYDGRGNLEWARQGISVKLLHRAADEAGTLYETGDRSDRVYGAGGRLEKSGVDTKELRNVFQGGQGRLVTRGVEFSYDMEGNLVSKTEPDGKAWRYEYYGNGMMSKAVGPDGGAVEFKYDPLGRRIEKKTPEKTTRFVWDGDNPLRLANQTPTQTAYPV